MPGRLILTQMSHESQVILDNVNVFMFHGSGKHPRSMLSSIRLHASSTENARRSRHENSIASDDALRSTGAMSSRSDTGSEVKRLET